MARSKKLTPAQIERMYDSGDNRVTQERNDFLLPQIIDLVRKEKWLNLRPEYQRRLVWERKKQSLFIESLLMNVPIPPIFLYEIDLSRYEVMDGQQRLNAVLDFYEGRLELTGLETWKVLNGLTYSTCPPRIKAGLDRRRVSANVLLAETIKSQTEADFIRRTVFERLNSGGQHLNHQELRNSLYSGPLNELLIELAGTRLFQTIWGIRAHNTAPNMEEEDQSESLESEPTLRNKVYSRMIDCEIVLRFFAFRDPSAIRGSVRRILDDYMKQNRNASPDEIEKLKTVFHQALEVAHAIFGTRTFQVQYPSGQWRPSQALFDALMVAIDKTLDKKAKLVRHKSKINRLLKKQLRRKRTYEIIVGKPNTARAVKDRLRIVSNLLRRAI